MRDSARKKGAGEKAAAGKEATTVRYALNDERRLGQMGPPPDACQQCANSYYLVDLLEERTQMLAQARHYQSRLRKLSSQVLTAHEEERKRVARELHDDAAQALTSILIRLRLLERSVREEAAQDGLKELRELTSATLDSVRRMAVDLRPSALDDLGLVAALQAYTKEFVERRALNVQFRVNDLKVRLPANVELVLYRLIQEALTNVAKHAGATNVDISLERRNGRVKVAVEDNGRGFNVDQVMTSKDRGLGLFGMQERLALVGGVLSIESKPGQGTRIAAEIAPARGHRLRP